MSKLPLSTFGALALFIVSVVCNPDHRYPRQNQTAVVGTAIAEANNYATTYIEQPIFPSSSNSSLQVGAVAIVNAASTQGGTGSAGSTTAIGTTSGGTTAVYSNTITQFVAQTFTNSSGIVTTNV